MPKRRLPPFVQARTYDSGRTVYRGWAKVEGARVWGPQREDAQQAYADAMALRADSENLPNLTVTLGTMFDLIIQEVRETRAAGYVRWWRGQRAAITAEGLLPAGMILSQITPEILRQFIRLRRRQVSVNTMNQHRRALHRLFEIAKRDSLARHNPVPDVAWPDREATQIEFFSMTEIRSLITKLEEVADSIDVDLVRLFALTGLRLSEGSRLTLDDVDIDKRQLWVRGKRRNETVVISEELAPVLVRLCRAAGDGPLLLGSVNAISHRFRRLAALTKEPRLRTHVLRHSYATALIRQGERVDVVRHLMRHQDIATTMRYVHMVQDDAKAAANRFRLLPPPPEQDADHA